ncbi:hypothetical protein BLA29_003886 [Euroglyphus maynei]|uniref:Uncharacterized protein n=1 Tax=Euroglyphus maynei TaxID=6958 RepID=A0A1Y3ALX0_EURMA|nr:hypothetical protein BLA29_003886 [Euroglyphus maynei]
MSYQTNSPPPSESSMSSSICESINNPSVPTSSSSSLFAGLTNFNHQLATSHHHHPHHQSITSSSPLQFALDAAQRSQLAVAAAAVAANQSNMMSTPSPNVSTHSSSGKRANRTRFTDYQIKVLQEFFESNAYPKDDDLEYLSKLLNLSPRVIVVWFQNARQKARKVYENQPPTTPVGEDDGTGRFQRTPGLNYQCKKCLQVFQRYYELIKHQKSSCFKDENPLSAQIRMAAEARAQATSPNVSTSRDSTSTPIDCTRSSSATPEKIQIMTSPTSVASPSPSLSGTKEVGLKKRVVQVWFQNTRARERKGQFRAHQQVIHKRCPFCRALFKARSALESHLATRHADQYTKGDINIDNLPDGDPSEDGDGPDMVNNADGTQMADVMKRYEDSFKKYLDELNIQGW